MLIQFRFFAAIRDGMEIQIEVLASATVSTRKAGYQGVDKL